MCHHEDDFGLRVKSHNYFATSHGKSPCDGIGAVAKRVTRRAALQNADKPILTPKDMYNYLKENVKDIR